MKEVNKDKEVNKENTAFACSASPITPRGPGGLEKPGQTTKKLSGSDPQGAFCQNEEHWEGRLS